MARVLNICDMTQRTAQRSLDMNRSTCDMTHLMCYILQRLSQMDVSQVEAGGASSMICDMTHLTLHVTQLMCDMTQRLSRTDVSRVEAGSASSMICDIQCLT